MTTDPKKAAADNSANQQNDHHPAYHRARGASPEEAERLAEEARKRHTSKGSSK